MSNIATQLDSKLQQWNPQTSATVEKLVKEIIDLADNDLLDLARSRQVEQEVLDILDEP